MPPTVEAPDGSMSATHRRSGDRYQAQLRAEMALRASTASQQGARLQGGPVIRPGGCKREGNKETLVIPVIPQLTADSMWYSVDAVPHPMGICEES